MRAVDDNLTDLVAELMQTARIASSGRAARTITGDHEHALRETVIALRGGEQLGEHESPGEATLQVLVGRVRIVAGDRSWDGASGDHLAIPPQRHRLDALEDSAVLLTVVKRPVGDYPASP
ncbi:cupin domain-containing protein [Microbacterium sp.]|jgi:quercetin dioxygenase-like cupin family protein|uniref:cupin domain-containing protein n=1 Tax=Microbacterium sp. TaxID=51671 RepID=UPI002D05E327|nr:cupin domain-containing protein [Microbacterium sp.]HWL76075.1 cupin domain-containing protein [Microbacterium sp.]